MILVYKCKHCKKEVRVTETAYDRFELYREFTSKNIKSKECTNCNSIQVLNVNDVYAIENNILKLTLFIIMLFGIVFGSIYAYVKLIDKGISNVVLVFIVLISVFTTLYLNWTVEQRAKVKYFNSNKL